LGPSAWLLCSAGPLCLHPRVLSTPDVHVTSTQVPWEETDGPLTLGTGLGNQCAPMEKGVPGVDWQWIGFVRQAIPVS
jgi:hypothetical protein